MSTQSPDNATQSLQDSHKETDSPSSPSKASLTDASGIVSGTVAGIVSPPLPTANSKHNVGRKAKKRKGRKGKRKPRLAGKPSGSKPQASIIETGTETQSQEQTTQPPATDHPAGEEGVCGPGQDGIGLHSLASKNVDKKRIGEETRPIEGVEDVLLGDGIEEVQTRAGIYAGVKARWVKAGDVCVRVYARPLNPRLILVEWEGEDGVEKHGRIVVNERQRGMFGPGKVVWVKGPLVGDKWLLAGKYNFLGNRVS